jgi:glycine cleavage system protein P-like pyridoxal-binding family
VYRVLCRLSAFEAIVSCGFHSPMACFTMTVKEAMMIEPTGMERRETLVVFIEAVKKIEYVAVERTIKIKSALQAILIFKPNETAAAKS